MYLSYKRSTEISKKIERKISLISPPTEWGNKIITKNGVGCWRSGELRKEIKSIGFK